MSPAMDRAAAARTCAAAALLGAAAVLGAALLLQHVGGVAPCHLCLVQRYPYYLVPLPLAAALAPAVPARAVPGLLALAALTFLASAGLAGHHVLVEAGALPAPTGCASDGLPAPGSVEAFAAALRNATVVACDRVGFRLLGLSLASWNLAASLALTLVSLLWAFPGGRALVAGLARPARGRPAAP